MQFTPVVTISFLLYAGVSGCLSPAEGDNCSLPKQKEWQIIIILMIVTGLFFVYFFFLAVKERVNSIYVTPCQKISCYSVWFFFPAPQSVHFPIFLVQGLTLQQHRVVCYLLSHLLRPKVTWMCWDTTWWGTTHPQHRVVLFAGLGDKCGDWNPEILMQKAPQAIVRLFTGFIDWIRIFHFHRECSW